MLRLIDVFKDRGLYVGSVAITQYSGQRAADAFKQRLNDLGIKVYTLYNIEGYPSNIPLIVSDEGYGKNEYIETTRPLVSSPPRDRQRKNGRLPLISSTMSTNAVSPPVMRNLRPSRSGTSPSSIR